MISALLALGANRVSGQDLEAEAALQGKILYKVEGKDIVLNAQAENTTTEEVILSYDFLLSGKDKDNNNLSNTQGGQAKLAPGENKMLASTSMVLADLNDFEAVLLIYYEDLLMDADTLLYSAEQQAQQNAESRYQEDISQEEDYEGQESGFEFGGLLIDNTRTRAGRDLYDLFYSRWESPKGAGDYYIKLEEYPGIGRTTRLIVWLDEEKVVELNLRPNYDYLEQLAGYIDSRLRRLLADRAKAGENLNDELQGIY